MIKPSKTKPHPHPSKKDQIMHNHIESYPPPSWGIWNLSISLKNVSTVVSSPCNISSTSCLLALINIFGRLLDKVNYRVIPSQSGANIGTHLSISVKLNQLHTGPVYTGLSCVADDLCLMSDDQVKLQAIHDISAHYKELYLYRVKYGAKLIVAPDYIVFYTLHWG